MTLIYGLGCQRLHVVPAYGKYQPAICDVSPENGWVGFVAESWRNRNSDNYPTVCGNCLRELGDKK